MCQFHQHGHVETWVTPESSRHLTSKMVQMHQGDEMPPHTTGPGREEVIVVLFGAVEVTLGVNGSQVVKTVVSGETCFIPEDTVHAVACQDEGGAQYAYVVTKRNLD